jgi:hypothetical protein
MPDQPQTADHQCWSVSSTSYIRALNSEERRADHLAIHYEKPPVIHDKSTTFSLILPMLVVSLYAGQPRELADRAAAILNKHWDGHDTPDHKARPDDADCPADVRILVGCAREVWELHGQSGDELDKALEAFASRVRYENGPDDEALLGEADPTAAATDATAAILVSLTQAGVPAYVLEILTHGDGRGGVAPGALVAAVTKATGGVA